MVAPLGARVAQTNQQFVGQCHAGTGRAGKAAMVALRRASPEVFPAPLSVHLTLLVPELIWPEPADQLALGKLAAPGLEWLLARARHERHPRRPFEKVLATCFGATDAPFGALRLLGEGSEDAAAATGRAPTRYTCAYTRKASSSPTPALSIWKRTKPGASRPRSMSSLPTPASFTSPAPGAGTCA